MKEFFPAQIHIPIPNIYFFEISESLAFCRNNGWLMENHGLGTHNDKLCADSSTENTPQFIWPTDYGHQMKA